MNQRTVWAEWTKEDYLNWLKTRGPAGTWGPDVCRKADNLIKTEALKNLEKHLEGIPKPIAQLARDMACCHYGSAEVDAALMKLNCYPEWMEKFDAQS